MNPVVEEEAKRMHPDRVAEQEGRLDTLKKAAGDAATGIRDLIVGISRRWVIYLPFTSAIESLRYWLKQKEIQAWMDSIAQSYHHEMGKARLANASRDEQEEIAHRHHSDQKWAEDELQRLYHSYYVHLANRLRIPVPAFQDDGGAWMESSVSDGWYLTPQAMHALRAEIRAERKARRDEWLAWIPLLALVVSIISALTALVVVWNN
jgi:hypothetical protein